MADTKRILVATAAPPLVLTERRTVRRDRDDPLPRLGRLAWLLAAISLPALGLTVADLVHRGGVPGAPQAAAPASPSDGAAAHRGAIPTFRFGMAPPPGLPRRDDRA